MRHPLSLSEHRKAKKLSQATLAEMLGVEQPTVQRWEAGTRQPDLGQIGALADALGVEPGALFRSPTALSLGPKLWVKGSVQAGVWSQAYEWAEDEWKSFTGRADITSPIDWRFGLEVWGDSMNEVYPHGTIVECVSVFGGAEIAPGKRVVVIRQREDLEYEATVKELVEQDGQLWLRPRSTNPTFRAFALDVNEPGIIETRIAAVVVASVRLE
ncbi:LexA family transcriptional regulator [Sphingomonas sp. AR_OL41]|uniref:helix-turn-helix domain-containing protein n=1 Tax=Sphingomonas sp. AR_OL41 TaxID=3042729 RepID=UPI00247FEC87|nr:LexA family transcriptional regulator [Sphingomonas sp. AR_OL41]MDH7973711.1 LexA family transcriptional regulator [Sphingomonas sp. AR_OL41]